MRTETTDERAAHDVVRWRREQLAGSGFPSRLAVRLAKDARYDLHALIELTEHGCAPELAARILAPLDPEDIPA
jgi:hypothetical protein